MSCIVKGGLKTGEKVGGSKKRVHFSDESPVSLADVCAAAAAPPVYKQIGVDAKSCRLEAANGRPGLAEVFAKASITCDVSYGTTCTGFRQFEANAAKGELFCSEEEKSGEAVEKVPDGNVTEFINWDSPGTTPPSGSYGRSLAIWDNGKSNRPNSHVKGVQRKLTFVVGGGADQTSKSKKHGGFTSKKNLSRVHNYIKVVPESEGHPNVMHTCGCSEAAAKKRCPWITANTDAVYVAYHDEEWGVPVHEDRRLFELLVFASAQSEISWSSILTKRQSYRDSFAQFDPAILATYDMAKVASIRLQHDIMKNEGKVQTIVSNAKVVMKIVEEFGSFNEYLWRFVSYKPIMNNYKQAKSIPMRTAKSEVISKDLQKRGMRHIGPMVIYSFMQAAGLANNHLLSCFCHPSSQSSSSPLPSSPYTKPLVSPLCC